MKKEEFYFDSRDNASKIYGVRYTPEDGQVKAVVQIVHGMAEHVKRYEEFAKFLTQRGFAVTAEDHLGHGQTAQKNGIKGYFCERDAATVVVRDVHRLKKMTQQVFPGAPYFILGHSMGSFILRNYLCRYGSGIDGAVIMGTGMQPKALVAMGKALTGLCRLFMGARGVCKPVESIAFGQYNKHFMPARTKSDWLTKDTAIVDAYEADPLCGFTFTVNGFQTLFELISRIQKPENLKRIPEKLPVFMVSGAEDPVGDYGRGVQRAYDSLKEAGLSNLTMKLYATDRHEILNETDRQQVMEDICAWIEGQLS